MAKGWMTKGLMAWVTSILAIVKQLFDFGKYQIGDVSRP
jgi:hypothetical protein